MKEDDSMENFFKLRAEKQKHIINSALYVFGKNGYKKASIADMAQKAGIAKGMVTYYFGSKKNLYLYLYEMCENEIKQELVADIDENVTDFFDRLKMIYVIKMRLMKKHANIFMFLTSVYYETDDEVAEELKEKFAGSLLIREKLLLGKSDTSKFKDDVDPKLIDRFLIWAAEGITDSVTLGENPGAIDEFIEDFFKCMELMKKYFYK